MFSFLEDQFRLRFYELFDESRHFCYSESIASHACLILLKLVLLLGHFTLLDESVSVLLHILLIGITFQLGQNLLLC